MSAEHLSVLFVDDDPFVVAAMRRMLRSLRDDFQLHFLEDSRLAVQFLQDKECDVLISDLQMPFMNGMELLRYTLEHHPGTVRYALSGQADPQREDPISDLAHGYLPKPCELGTLRSLLTSLAATRARVLNSDLRSRCTLLRGLPVATQSLEALETYLRDQRDSSLLLRFADCDPGLGLNILRLACFAGPRQDVRLPSEAFSELRQASLCQLLQLARRHTTPLDSRGRHQVQQLFQERWQAAPRTAHELDRDSTRKAWYDSWIPALCRLVQISLRDDADVTSPLRDVSDVGCGLTDEFSDRVVPYLLAIWRIHSTGTALPTEPALA